jgi:ABC-type phosphate/phosphonate transport system substrate-binding protein
MKKIKCLSVILICVGLISSCSQTKSKSADIATGMCSCFNMLKDSMPAEAMKVFELTAVADKPQETFDTEMKKLKPDVVLKVNAALMSTTKASSPVNTCIKELDKKYKTNETDQQAMALKMIDELKDKKGCEIMMALLRMNLKK